MSSCMSLLIRIIKTYSPGIGAMRGLLITREGIGTWKGLPDILKPWPVPMIISSPGGL